jgi:integrase
MVKYSHRGGIYYSVDRVTGARESLETKDKERAQELLSAKNEASRESAFNLQKARIYGNASDPLARARTWDDALAAIIASKPADSENRSRWETAAKDKALNSLRQKVILVTSPQDLLHVLDKGSISTNVFLRRLHNFCIGMNWLPWPILPKQLWPKVKHKSKRAITLEEHNRIIEREPNPERRAFYELCWELGGSQTDIANLTAEDVNWEDRTICYYRKKLLALEGIRPPLIRFGKKCEAILRSLPQTGSLFPYLRTVDCKDRATEFKQRCEGLEIKGVTLHSYRYAWAERARTAGYPRRFAEEALGHNSKAVHAAYASKAQVVVPSLEDYEEQLTKQKVVSVQFHSTETPRQFSSESAAQL